MDGKCPPEQFFELYEKEISDEDYESNTVGGWVTELCGQLPTIGEILHFEDIEIKIVKATKQKVLKIRSRLLTAEEMEERKKDDKE